MKILKKLANFKVLAGMTLIASTLTTSFSIAPANAQRFCQCTDYVANRFGLTRNYPHAGDWDNGYLQNNRFRRVGVQPGAIVVMERSFPGANTAFGHVGVVESIDSRGRITVRGANQSVGSPLANEAGCSNVRSTGFGTSINGRGDISFWVR
jgi:surface antigen